MRTYSAGIVTAYGSAKAGGYTGTYAEFCEALGDLANVLEDLEGLTVVANTLPEGSSATASYSDGVLTLGIPKGDKGEQGEQGIQGETGNGIEGITATKTGLVTTFTIHFTDGTEYVFSLMDGAGISNITFNADYTLTIELTNGRSYTTTSIRGETGNGIESVELTSTSGAVKTYTITFTDGTTTTFDVTDGEVTNESLAETLEDYALTDGYYEEMTVGDAEQLVATQYVEDSVPYLFRTTGGSADVGNREYVDEIVGGTVAWNQLVGASDTSVTVPSGHKYISYINGTRTVANSTGTIIAVTGGTDTIHDLTQMFGSTIADYIYSLETANAGAGVAFFKKLFPNDYYEYNEGELISVSGLSSHDTVGFNQWDEEWELGAISTTTGKPTASSSNIRSKNFCPCLSDFSYYGCATNNPSSFAMFFYDADKTYIGFIATASVRNKVFVTPSGARYFKLYLSGTTYNNDICINLSWSGYRNGEYEEYQKHSYALDDSLTLRGIPKLDSANNLYYDGDTYASNGTVTRNTILRAYQSGDEELANAITDGTNTVVYQANASTEQAEPYQQVQICDDFGTEEFVSTSIVPVGHNTRYPDNLRDKLQHLPSLASQDGTYAIHQSNNQMSLVTIPTAVSDLPDAPTTDGTYTLKVTVTDGTPTYTWEVVE